MYSIIGILIVAFGFFAPYLSKGMISATLFFWIGFLLLDIIVFMLIAIILGRYFTKRRRYLY